MKIQEYLLDNDFQFIDRVGFSKNHRVSRQIHFKRYNTENARSGKITYFKNGECSYSLKTKQHKQSEPQESKGVRVSLTDLEQRIESIFI